MRPSAIVHVVNVDLSEVRSDAPFHDVFATTFGFPGFYGRNMDAWSDCMSSLDSPQDCMTTRHVTRGGALTINITGIEAFAQECPTLCATLVECVAFVNWRRIESGAAPLLLLAYNKTPIGN